jgi:translation initiation factor IF-1
VSSDDSTGGLPQKNEEGEPIVLSATVINELSSIRYRVELANGQRVTAGLSGKMRLSLIRVLPGARVRVEFSPYDLSNGRIIEEEKIEK